MAKQKPNVGDVFEHKGKDYEIVEIAYTETDARTKSYVKAKPIAKS